MEISKSDKNFNELTKQALYYNYDSDLNSLIQNPTITAIASLVMASKRGSTSHIVSFNYDDILETYLDYYGYVTNSISDECHWSGNYDAHIHHLHGYLPSRPNKTASKNIVLDMESYNVINESDLWRQEISTILRTHFCIYIGLSGEDDNLDRMLHSIKTKHIATKEGSIYMGLVFKKKNDESTLWKKRKIFPFEVNNFEKEIPKFLLNVCQTAAELK